MDLEQIKHSYLSHIKIFIQSQNNDKHLLRSFIDNWFAYNTKGPFLNKNDRPIWFNNPDPVKSKEALLGMHFISNNAYQVIQKGLKVRLIKEHSLPVSVIYSLLADSSFDNETDIEKFLFNYYRLGVLTKEEDDILSSVGLKSKMPKDWNPEMSVFYRYEVAGITEKQLPHIQ